MTDTGGPGKRQPPVVRIAHRSRISYLSLDKGVLRIDGHCLLLQREDGEGLEIPASLVSCIFLEPGVSVTHEAVKLCAEHGTALFWVGEGLTRLYSAAYVGADPQRVLRQCSIHASPPARIEAARRLYGLMFGETAPPSLSIEKLRGIEGAKVRKIYKQIADARNLSWSSKEQAPKELAAAIGFATSCLYAISEVAILAAGYTACVGVVHSGNSRSLVFDLADTVKFESVVPLAFDVYATGPANINMAVRHACRDLFNEKRLFETLLENLATIMGEGDANP